MGDEILATGGSALTSADVHCWAVGLETTDAVVVRFRSLLTAEEHQRADRFRQDQHRRSFIVTRGALRVLLGRHLGAEPAAIRFRYGSHGKPQAADGGQLEFNASDTDGLALFAFARACEVGVDVEKVRPVPDAPRIAAGYFCEDEAADLASLPAGLRDRAFFRCWTRKEAFLKATGEGLSADLSRVRVTLRPGEAARLVRIGDEPGSGASWRMQDLEVGADYAAAVAYRGVPRAVSLWTVVDAAVLLGPAT